MRSGAVASLARYLRRSVTAAGKRDRKLPGAAVSRKWSTQSAAGRGTAADAASCSHGCAAAEIPLIRTDRCTFVWLADLDVDEDGPLTAVLGDREPSGPTEHEQDAEMLRSRREKYSLQGVACLGEYLESVAPLMQACPAPLSGSWHTHPREWSHFRL